MYQEEPDDEDEEPDLPEGSQVTRRQRIGKYFGWHLRRQVAFDIWWLVWAIFIVCIVERGKIMDDQNAPWFNLFRISTSSWPEGMSVPSLMSLVLLQSSSSCRRLAGLACR